MFYLKQYKITINVEYAKSLKIVKMAWGFADVNFL